MKDIKYILRSVSNKDLYFTIHQKLGECHLANFSEAKFFDNIDEAKKYWVTGENILMRVVNGVIQEF